jgi:hypothetical protein
MDATCYPPKGERSRNLGSVAIETLSKDGDNMTRILKQA